MAITSAAFIAFVTTVVLLTNAVPTAAGRRLVLLLASLVFVASHASSPVQLLPLAAFLLLSWLLIEAARRSRSPTVLWAGLAGLIACFVFLKKYSFLDASLLLSFPYLIVGLSYVLFRVLHLLIDAQQGELTERISPLQFLSYTCNFLTFTAGPIQRYQDHTAQQREPSPLDEQKVFRAFARIIRGFVKVGVLSAIFNYLFSGVSERLLDVSMRASFAAFAAMYLAAAICYTVYLYANFAGYMDIVIGVGWLIGQELPENFNRPFLARSFLDFWARWHMTLSDWFKTYLFNPLLKTLATRFTSARAAPYSAVIAFFATFLVMGIWHGSTSVFVVYGLLLGAGASLNKAWQVAITKRLGKKRYKLESERPIAIYLSRGLTLAYFAIALSCLWLDMQQLRWVLQQLMLVGVVACYFCLAALAAAAFFFWDTLTARLASFRPREDGLFDGVVARNLALGSQIMLIVLVSTFFHKAPEFVYRAF